MIIRFYFYENSLELKAENRPYVLFLSKSGTALLLQRLHDCRHLLVNLLGGHGAVIITNPYAEYQGLLSFRNLLSAVLFDEFVLLYHVTNRFRYIMPLYGLIYQNGQILFYQRILRQVVELGIISSKFSSKNATCVLLIPAAFMD